MDGGGGWFLNKNENKNHRNRNNIVVLAFQLNLFFFIPTVGHRLGHRVVLFCLLRISCCKEGIRHTIQIINSRNLRRKKKKMIGAPLAPFVACIRCGLETSYMPQVAQATR